MPVRKVPAVLHALTGVQLTQGALTQDALPHAEGPLGAAYEGLRAAVPEARWCTPMTLAGVLAVSPPI